MPDYYRARRGLPRFRQKLERGEPAHIVAFGSSITERGHYLAAVAPALLRAYPAAQLRLTKIGRSAFDSVWAAFDAQSAVAERPDLVLLEFAINDYYVGIRPFIAPALLGTIAQIRETLPECEFVFVYHGRLDAGVPADRTQIEIHDAVAQVLDIPSIDVDRLSADLVARGAAVYVGDAARALTTDGTHQAEAAADLIGQPFAAALGEILRAGSDLEPPVELPPLADLATAAVAASGGTLAGSIVPQITFDGETFCRLMAERHALDMSAFNGMILSKPGPESELACDTLFRRARRAAPSDFIASDGWGVRQGKPRRGIYHRDESLVALEAGATLRFPLLSRFACFLGFANGSTITVRIDGVSGTILPKVAVAGEARLLFALAVANRLDEGRHVVEISADAPQIAFNDIYYIDATPLQT